MVPARGGLPPSPDARPVTVGLVIPRAVFRRFALFAHDGKPALHVLCWHRLLSEARFLVLNVQASAADVFVERVHKVNSFGDCIFLPTDSEGADTRVRQSRAVAVNCTKVVVPDKRRAIP